MSLDVVSDIYVEGLIKQQTPNKRYVFPIQVEWKNGVLIQIYRSYKNIFDLQLKLLKIEEFLTYLKNEYAENRTGYLLRDKTLFGKLGVKTQKKALIKLREVDEFLKSVIYLPSSISQCDVVLQFFHPLPDDLMYHYNEADDFTDDQSVKETKGTSRKGYAVNISEPILLEQYVAICDYKKTQKNGLSLRAGNIVEVITMGEHGWWFVDLDGDLGWVPASLLTPRDGEDEDHEVLNVFGEGEEEMCFAMGTYKPSSDDEVALEVGQILQVKQKNIDGWWLVSGEGTTGWAPCMYLHVLESSTGYTRQMEREAVMTNMRSKNIFAITDRRTTWNPLRPITSMRKGTVKRRPHHDIRPEELEDQPSYVNIVYDKNSKQESDTSDEESPSYVNYDLQNPKKSGKRRSKNKNPSYMNMAYHNKKDNARMRRRREPDGDLVELDFSKEKTSDQSETVKEEAKKEQVDENSQLQKIDEESAACDSSKAQVDIKDENSKETTENCDLKTQEVNKTDDKEHQHVEVNQLMTQRNETPLEDDVDLFLSIGDYTKDSDTEVNLEEGKSVQVLEQTDGGWWLVRTQSLSVGWAPSNFLEKISPKELKRRKTLGLVSPERPPLRPPKSKTVHKKAVEISQERKFWSFVKKNDKDATCSIVDIDGSSNHFSNVNEKEPLDENQLVEGKDKWLVSD